MPDFSMLHTPTHPGAVHVCTCNQKRECICPSIRLYISAPTYSMATPVLLNIPRHSLFQPTYNFYTCYPLKIAYATFTIRSVINYSELVTVSPLRLSGRGHKNAQPYCSYHKSTADPPLFDRPSATKKVRPAQLHKSLDVPVTHK